MHCHVIILRLRSIGLSMGHLFSFFLPFVIVKPGFLRCVMSVLPIEVVLAGHASRKLYERKAEKTSHSRDT